MMLIGAVVFDAPTPVHYDLLSLTEQLHCWLRLSTRLSGTMLERSRTVACALGLDMHALCLLSHRRADRRVLGAIAAGRLAMIAALVDLERLRCSSHPEEAQAAFRALREVRECVR